MDSLRLEIQPCRRSTSRMKRLMRIMSRMTGVSVLFFLWGGGGNVNVLVEERQRLADAVKHHQRDRNRAPSEPAGKRTHNTLQFLS
jgi:hypothetical protein